MINDDLTKNIAGVARAILEGKKLDPVGKADADIDNDGDVDSSDEYLKKRRAAISKAMKDEGNAFTKALAAAKEKGEGEFVVAGKKYQVKEVEELEKDKDKDDIKEGYFMKEFEPGEYDTGDEKLYVDIIKKAGGRNIKIYKPDRSDPQLSIDFKGGNIKKMQKELEKMGDGTEDLGESLESLSFEVSENLSPTSKKFIDMMNDMMKHKHGSKEFKAKKKEIDMFLKKNSGKM